MRSSMRVFGVLCIVVLFLGIIILNAQTVIKRERIGNYTEGITFAEEGPFAGNVLASDGWFVKAIDVRPGGQTTLPRTILDITSFPLTSIPRGIVWNSEDNRLYMTYSESGRHYLYVVQFTPEGTGSLLNKIEIIYNQNLNFLPWSIDGVTFLPADATIVTGDPTVHPHLAAMVMGWNKPRVWPNLKNFIAIMDLDGSVEFLIPLQGDLAQANMLGIAYLKPDRFAVCGSDTNGRSRIWVLNADGSQATTPGPIDFPDPGSPEGITLSPSGNLWVASADTGYLYGLTSDLGREPSNDRDFKTGVGVNVYFGVKWNPMAEALSVSSGARRVINIPPTLVDPPACIFDATYPRIQKPWYLGGADTTRGEMSIVESEAYTAANLRTLYRSRYLTFIDLCNDTIIRKIDLAEANTTPLYPLYNSVFYRGSTEQYGFINRTDGLLYFVNHLSGESEGATTIDDPDVASAGISSLDWGETIGTKQPFFLVLSGAKAYLFGDGSDVPSSSVKQKWAEINTSSLGLKVTDQVSYIATGPHQGTFAAVDIQNSEIAIFEWLPIAAAGPDQTIEVTCPDSALITLDATCSRDPLGNPLGFIWSDENGTVIGTQALVTVEIPVGSHRFRLTVQSAWGPSASDDVEIAVVVKSANQQITDLVEAIEQAVPPIENGIYQDLLNKLRQALQHLSSGNSGQACHKLTEFADTIQKELKKNKPKLTPEQGEEFLSKANCIRAAIGC